MIHLLKYKLEELKSLLSHKSPSLSYGELLLILSEEALEKHDPVRRGKRAKKRSMKKKTNVSTKTILPATAIIPTKTVLPIKAVIPAKAGNQKRNMGSCPRLQRGKFTGTTNSWEEQTKAEKLELQQTKQTKTTSPEKWKYAGKPKKLSRAIPLKLKRHIWERDKGQCSYVHPGTKRRCGSKHLLQIDHIKPFSLGGRSELNNLRLLCADHNRYRSERTFKLYKRHKHFYFRKTDMI